MPTTDTRTKSLKTTACVNSNSYYSISLQLPIVSESPRITCQEEARHMPSMFMGRHTSRHSSYRCSRPYKALFTHGGERLSRRSFGPR